MIARVAPHRWASVLSILLLVATSCKRQAAPIIEPWSGFEDKTFYSVALDREVTYRVSSSSLREGRPVHVVYLLHGNGGTYREWSQSSAIARLAPADWMLVMPEGGSSYWMNSASVAADRYEDFVTQELVAEAERGLAQPVDRAIVGNSMGGFAALVLAMKHPGLYSFAGALSPPVDYPERAFNVRRWGQSMAIRAIFGATGSATRKANDPFVLALHVDPASMPYLFLSVGDAEPLLEPVRRFDALLTRRGIAHEFHVMPGGHDWGEWNEALPALIQGMGETHSSR